jgi:hypothetical protein
VVGGTSPMPATSTTTPPPAWAGSRASWGHRAPRRAGRPARHRALTAELHFARPRRGGRGPPPNSGTSGYGMIEEIHHQRVPCPIFSSDPTASNLLSSDWPSPGGRARALPPRGRRSVTARWWAVATASTRGPMPSATCRRSARWWPSRRTLGSGRALLLHLG